MTDVVRGTVLGLDRENGTVRAEIGGVVVPAAPYLGEPPWPLASCWFFNAPAYTCLGPIGNRRVAFADDFNFYTAGTPLIGGSGWTSGGAAGGSLSTPNNPTDANGVLRLTNTTIGGAGYFIRKTLQMVTLTDTRCYWMSARVRTNQAAGSLYIGLADANVMTGGAGATRAAVFAVLTGSLTSYLFTQISGATGSLLNGELIAADTWMWVDVMVVGGQWAAMWVDGSGPWVSTEYLPSTSYDSVTPFLSVVNVSASTAMDVDYASLALVDLATTADPTTFGELDPVDDVLT